MPLKKLVGMKSQHGNPSGTVAVIIGDKVVNTVEPVNLTVEEIKTLEDKGYILTQGTKSEVEMLQKIKQLSPVVGDDVVSASPVFGHRINRNST